MEGRRKHGGVKYERGIALGKETVLGAGRAEDELEALDSPVVMVKRLIQHGLGPANRAMRHMRAELAKLTEKQLATFVVYVHSRETHAFETVELLQVTAKAKQVTYCEGCSSCRSKFVSEKGVSKRLHGLEIDLKQGEAFCSVCPKTRVQLVRVDKLLFETKYVNRVIYRLFPCTGCNVLTGDTKVIGDNLLCKFCVKRHENRPIAESCYLCKHSSTRQFVAYSRQVLSWVGVCEKHFELLPRELTSVEALKAKYGKAKRAHSAILRLPWH